MPGGNCRKRIISHLAREAPTLRATFGRRKDAIEDERFNKTARSKRREAFLNTGILPAERPGMNGPRAPGTSFVLTRRLSANERFDG